MLMMLLLQTLIRVDDKYRDGDRATIEDQGSLADRVDRTRDIGTYDRPQRPEVDTVSIESKAAPFADDWWHTL